MSSVRIPLRRPVKRSKPTSPQTRVAVGDSDDDTVAHRLKRARGKLWISPPAVKHGIQIVAVIVGPNADLSSSVNQQTFSIHRNLLITCSSYFQAALIGNFQESTSNTIKLLEDIPQVFQVLYDWLYSGIASEQDETGIYKTDHFWLLVYQMADRLLIDGLKVIAYERFRACFNPVSSRILPDKRIIVPSKELVAAVFDTANDIDLFRAWIIDHILWYYHTSPSELSGMDVLLNDYPNLASEVGRALIVDKIEPVTDRLHPSFDTSFAKEHGLDTAKIREESRTPLKVPGVKYHFVRKE